MKYGIKKLEISDWNASTARGKIRLNTYRFRKNLLSDLVRQATDAFPYVVNIFHRIGEVWAGDVWIWYHRRINKRWKISRLIFRRNTNDHNLAFCPQPKSGFKKYFGEIRRVRVIPWDLVVLKGKDLSIRKVSISAKYVRFEVR